MKNFFLAAAIAAAPVLAATTADAITVPAGSNLQITFSGTYTNVAEGGIVSGSQVTLGNPFVSLIDFNNASVADFGGVTVGSSVTPSGGPLTLSTGSVNDGLAFTFAQGSVFTITDSVFSSVESGTPGASRVEGSGSLDLEDGSFRYATTTSNNFGQYQVTIAVPPVVFGEVNVVPLPAAAWMLLAGLGSLWAFRRRTHA